MSFQDYRPTHRETEVLSLLKSMSGESVSRSYIYQHTGATASVIDATLQNLELLGCVKCLADDEYVFVRDPTDAAFD